jgi:Domain of unknown function (DUF5615)
LRLVLDANLSAKRIGAPLAKRGHDVRAISAEPDLEGLDDESVLELAARDGRVLVTRNSRDIAPLCRSWAEGEREHAGVILVWTFTHAQFAEIVDGVDRWLIEVPRREEWLSLVVSI